MTRSDALDVSVVWDAVEPKFRTAYERAGCGGMSRATGASKSTVWAWYAGETKPRGSALKALGFVLERLELRGWFGTERR